MGGRNKTRSSLVYLLKVLEAKSGELLGYLWDASTDGLNLISESPLTVGRRYHLAVAYPKTDQDAVEVTAETMWSRPDPESEFHRSGLWILPGQDEAVKRISAMVDEYRFVDPPNEWASDIGER